MSILLLGFDTESDMAAGNETKDSSVPMKSFKDYYLQVSTKCAVS